MKMSFDYLLSVFREYLKGIGYAEETLRCYEYSLKTFFNYLIRIEKTDIREITREDIESFIKSLKGKVTMYNKKIKTSTIAHIITEVKALFRYLYMNEIILVDPAHKIRVKKGIKGKRELFSREEMTDFLESIDVDETNGERDRAVFELLYSSGLRIGEVCHLNLTDIDLKERILLVRKGKGDKDRYVPFSEVVQKFLKLYINGERKKNVKSLQKESEKSLFLSRNGRISHEVVRGKFRKILKSIGLNRENLTVHSIRHSTATHLLNNGANVRYVAELLGHENLQTTTIYTHCQLENLKRVYKSSHPRENEYYTEVENEYLVHVKKLIADIKKRQEINRRYPSPREYAFKKKID